VVADGFGLSVAIALRETGRTIGRRLGQGSWGHDIGRLPRHSESSRPLRPGDERQHLGSTCARYCLREHAERRYAHLPYVFGGRGCTVAACEKENCSGSRTNLVACESEGRCARHPHRLSIFSRKWPIFLTAEPASETMQQPFTGQSVPRMLRDLVAQAAKRFRHSTLSLSIRPAPESPILAVSSSTDPSPRSCLP
jgi:hypothetical protein